jgi:hypothetical protein
VRDSSIITGENFADLRVPRQWLLVLLIKVLRQNESLLLPTCCRRSVRKRLHIRNLLVCLTVFYQGVMSMAVVRVCIPTFLFFLITGIYL